MCRTCKLILAGFLLLYAAALCLLAIGTFGLFGSERDPLAGVFLIPLGLPWILLGDSFPDSFRPWFAAGAPLINVLGIWLICRVFFTKSLARKQA